MNNLSNDTDRQSIAVPVFIYVALPCEAKPLVKYFKLKKDEIYQGFPLYKKDNIHLVISGLGKTAMAAAIGFSQALMGSSRNSILINVGIAGHRTHSIGDKFCIDKITDDDTNKDYYPQLVAKLPCPTNSLTTLSSAKTDYPEMCLYDMEASAFYQTALRFTTSELIQCLKVISDNESSTIKNINPLQTSELISDCLKDLDTLVLKLAKLASLSHYFDDRIYQELLEKWHFTASNRIKLKFLLNQWQVLTNHAPLTETINSGDNGKTFLKTLARQIELCEYQL